MEVVPLEPLPVPSAQNSGSRGQDIVEFGEQGSITL